MARGGRSIFGISAAVVLVMTMAVAAVRRMADVDPLSAGITIIPGGSIARHPKGADLPRAWAATAGGAEANAFSAAAVQRSSLYPTNWRPMDINSPTYVDTPDGRRFLHDFSYAGYGRGQVDATIPSSTGSTIMVAAPRGGGLDDTLAIQSAIDQACAAGGGVVLLRPGVYRVRPQNGSSYSIALHCNRTILRGTLQNGALSTYILNDDPNMRNKTVIQIQPRDTADSSPLAWYLNVRGGVVNFGQGTSQPTRVITLASDAAPTFAVNDKVVVRTTINDAFRSRHNVPADQWTEAGQQGLMYFRKITKLSGREITLDSPVRYEMLLQDNPRVHKTADNVLVVGIEDLQLGMRENTRSGVGDKQFDQPGTGAYEMHGSSAILVNRAEGVWIRNVRSYATSLNTTTQSHILSKGITLYRSTRNVTIDNVHLQKPQYRGEGGNGYLFSVSGMDHLLTNTSATGGRHNYLLTSMSASGNVFHRCVSRDALKPSDTHAGLSHANLYDGCVLDGDHFQSTNRHSDSGGAGITATQNVYWNTQGDSNPGNNAQGSQIIATAQYKWGYVIGTRGAYNGVFAPSSGYIGPYAVTSAVAPADFVEFVGGGASLEPQSLFADQVNRRKARGDCTSACPLP